MRDRGATSARAFHQTVSGMATGSIIGFSEAPDLAGIGRLMDSFNDLTNEAAMKVRSDFEGPDSPVASFQSVMLQEIAY